MIAGLVADGITTVSGAQHIDRGYAGFAESMQGLGADVTREPERPPFRDRQPPRCDEGHNSYQIVT